MNKKLQLLLIAFLAIHLQSCREDASPYSSAKENIIGIDRQNSVENELDTIGEFRLLARSSARQESYRKVWYREDAIETTDKLHLPKYLLVN